MWDRSCNRPCPLRTHDLLAVRCGEAQYGIAVVLLFKAICELTVTRTRIVELLHICVFVMGLVTSVLDTARNLLVTRILEGERALLLNVHGLWFAAGAMLGPFAAVALGDRAWTMLAVIEILSALIIARKRQQRGKPRHWKVKVRHDEIRAMLASQVSGDLECISPGTCTSDGERGESSERTGSKETDYGNASFTDGLSQSGLPPELCMRMVLLFLAQAAETAVASWAFSLAYSELGQRAKVAAAFPSCFYLLLIVARFSLPPVSHVLQPSTLVQSGMLLLVTGVAVLHASADKFVGLSLVPGASPAAVPVKVFVFSLALIGVGLGPIYMLASAPAHRQNKLFRRDSWMCHCCCTAGTCMGLWLPGLIGLHRAEMISVAGILCILLFNRCRLPDETLR